MGDSQYEYLIGVLNINRCHEYINQCHEYTICIQILTYFAWPIYYCVEPYLNVTINELFDEYSSQLLIGCRGTYLQGAM